MALLKLSSSLSLPPLSPQYPPCLSSSIDSENDYGHENFLGVGELPTSIVYCSLGPNPIRYLLDNSFNFRAPESTWRYKIRREISNGGFATVYEAECLDGYKAGHLFAIKVDSKPLFVQCDMQGGLVSVHEDSSFQYNLGGAEVNAFCQLWPEDDMEEWDQMGAGGGRQVPYLVESGLIRTMGRSPQDQTYVAVHRFIIMQLLGNSILSSVKCKCEESQLSRHNCSPKAPYRFLTIARSCLRALESIHAYGLIHRDVKTANFCFRDHRGRDDEVCIIDFGFCRDRDPDPERIRESFVGTPDYASHRALRGLPQRPQDDLESLGYTFLELYLGELPWDLTYISAPGVNGWPSRSYHISSDQWTNSLLCDMSNRRLEVWSGLIEKPRGPQARIPLFVQEWMSYICGLDVHEAIDYDRLDEILCLGVSLDQDKLRERARDEFTEEPGGYRGNMSGEGVGGREEEYYEGLRSCGGSVGGDEVVRVNDSQGSCGGRGSQGIGSSVNADLHKASQGSNGMMESGPFPHNNDDDDFQALHSGAQRAVDSGASAVMCRGAGRKRKIDMEGGGSGIKAGNRSRMF